MIELVMMLNAQEPNCGSAEHAAAVHAEINMHNEMIEALVPAGNVDGYAAHFTEDAVQLPPNAEALRGREAIHSYWSTLMEWGTVTFDLEAVEVEVCGPQAVELGAYTFAFEAGENAPEGMMSFSDEGHYLVMWVEGEDMWRVKYDAPVSTQPLPGQGE